METEKTLLTGSEESSTSLNEAQKGESSANDKAAHLADSIEDGNLAWSRSPLELESIWDHHKLNECNYFTWYYIVRNSLRVKRRAFIHITDTGPKPEDPGYKEWHSDDCMVMLWLWNCMSPNIAARCSVMESAKDIWDSMHRTYFKSRRLVKLYDLKVKICSAEQESKTVQEYLGRLKCLWNELEFYRGTLEGWPKDEASIKRLVEEDRTLDFLTGLRPEFDQLRNEFLFSKELPSLNEVYDRIWAVEILRSSRMRSRNENNLATDMDKLHVSEYRNPRQSNDKIWCTYCNKPYHTREQCWKLHGRP